MLKIFQTSNTYEKIMKQMTFKKYLLGRFGYFINYKSFGLK